MKPNKKYFTKGKMHIDGEDVEMVRRAFEAYDFALLHQQGLAEAAPAIKDYIVRKVDELRQVKNKYFPNPNEIYIPRAEVQPGSQTINRP